MSRKQKAAFHYAIRLLVGLLVVFPLIYGIDMSFMTAKSLATYPPQIIPSPFILSNYTYVLTHLPLLRYTFNSLLVCAIVIVFQTFIGSLAAYSFSFFKYRGQKFLFTAVLSTMMIPGETTIVANYLTVCNLRLVDTYAALVLPHLASGLSIFLLRQFYLTLPFELRQAAAIDGCGDMRYLFIMVLPLSVPCIVSLALNVFVLTYNQYLWPLLVTNSENLRTVQIGISRLIDAESENYGYVLAGAMIVLIPVSLVFIIGQKYLIKGMATAGSIKG